ncbi:MAG TPA: VWA domain-containing protein [Thermoanaerobaculia bacterium]|jgi:VWFA-related protein
MLRSLGFLTLLFALSSSAADAPSIPWHTAPSTALAVARAQGKLLLVYFRNSDCRNCNAVPDAMFAKVAADEVFLHSLETFLPLRLDKNSPQHELVDELKKHPKLPVVALYDALGKQLVAGEAEDLRWDRFGELLVRYRGAQEAFVAAAALRQKGDAALAEYALGHAYLAARDPERAAKRYDEAARAFGKARREEQQIAGIAAGYAWFAAGMKTKGLNQVNALLRDAVSDAVAAEAHLRLGAIWEAGVVTKKAVPNSRIATAGGSDVRNNAPIGYTSVTTKDQQTLDRAISAYRKAYDLAPPGSAALDSAQRALARLDDRPLPPKEGMQSTLRLIAPARPAIVGEADFLAEAGPGVARVDFFLDGKQVASRNRAPFRATIDVGPLPTAHSIRARAFDTEGNALAESVVSINERADAFLVTFLAPMSDVLRGPADAEVDVRVPPGRTLKQVEVFWNDQPVATLTRPPFRASVTGTGEFGFLRAVASLDDGTTAEATKVFNTPAAAAESVEVAAVTLIAGVTNRAGKPVAGLRSSDFTVHDDGTKVDAEVRSSDEDPVTVGIAIDSSSSMAGRHIYVIRAATEFISNSLRPRDEAFVVAFDTAPRLVHPRSNDDLSLGRAVLDLVPAGGTSIFDGVTFALQQFQGIPGKRALIVLSDGREGTSSASAKEAERLARSMGIPIYAIVPPGGERVHHALLDIVEATGGTMHYATPVDKLGELSDRLADEVRGQYVLSFTRPAGVKAGEWRSIRVAVRRPDANVRTIQGYRAN